MNYPIVFSKRWFLLSALLMHLGMFLILIRLSDLPTCLPMQSVIISLPTDKLDLQAGLRAGDHSFNPNPDAQSCIKQDVCPTNNRQKIENPAVDQQKGSQAAESQHKELPSSDKPQRVNQASITARQRSKAKKNTYPTAPSSVKRIEVATSKTPYDPAAHGGYVYSKAAGGTAFINKPGSLNVPATTHDTIYANYLAKMLWHLQANARHMHALNFLLKTISGIKTARIRMVIARDGSLLEAGIISSSGTNELDEMMLKAIKTANPYPPLPNYFPSNSFVYDGWLSIEGLK